MSEYITDHSQNPHTYLVVYKQPPEFDIWNIGKNNAPEGYLPFCCLSNKQPFPGGQSIDTDTLRALKCDGWDVILDAIGFGPQNSTEMEKYIAKNRKKQSREWICERMKKAIPYLKNIGR